MVAYSFKQQFVSPIMAGHKRGTIRANGKRQHAVPGQTLQLYTAMRTRSCRLIAEAPCQAVDRIVIRFSKDGHHDTVRVAERPVMRGFALDAFAGTDGFTGWTAMRAFWAENHPGIVRFEGVWIRWGDLSGGMLLA